MLAFLDRPQDRHPLSANFQLESHYRNVALRAALPGYHPKQNVLAGARFLPPAEASIV